MTKAFKTIYIISFLILLLFPSLLFASGDDSFYDSPGFDPNRVTESIADFEQIDPYTGGLTLNFVDMRLPGDGGLDLVIQRTYNSKNACRNWLDTNGLISCQNTNIDQGESSWVGMGWSLHMGRVLVSSRPIIEMPDGSLHVAYLKAGYSTKFITKDYWILDYDPASPTPYILTFTDGRKIYFGKTYDYTDYYATKIEDTNGNEINITYYPYNNGEELLYKGTIQSITDSTGRTTSFTLTSNIGGKKRLSYITRPDGEKITFSYIEKSSLSAVLDSVQPPEGNSWRFQYSTDIYELTNITTPYGGSIGYQYNTSGFYYNSNQCWTAHRTVYQKTTSGINNPGTCNFSYFQNPNNEYTLITDPCGRSIKYRHYGYNSSLNNGDFWKLGLPISKEITGEETIAYGWIRSTSYISNDDYQGLPCNSTKKDYDVYVPYLSSHSITRDGQTYTTTYSNYDSYGNAGLITEIGDTARNTNITYWKDETKNIVKDKPDVVTLTGTFEGTFTIDYDYFTTGVKAGKLQRLNKYGIVTDYDYHSNGNLWYEKDAENKYRYNDEWQYGQVKTIRIPSEYTINRQINNMGLVDWEDDGRGNKTYYQYNGNLQIKKITPPIGNPTDYSYNYNPFRVGETRGGFTTTYVYDGLGRLDSTSNSIGVTTGIYYKSCGLKDATSSNIGDTVHFDNLGRVEDVMHQDNYYISYLYSGSNVTITDETRNYSTQLYYKAFGNPDDKLLWKVIDARNKNTEYSYNIIGKLTNINQFTTDQGTITRTFEYYTYDPKKSLLYRETHPEKGTITYDYYNNGLLRTKQDGKGTKTYTYDNANRLISITDGINTIDFDYEGVASRTVNNSPGASITYEYDSANRLRFKRETILGKAYTTEYQYDNNDNLTDIYYPSLRHVYYKYDITKGQVKWVENNGTQILSDITYYTTGNETGLPKSFTHSNNLTTNLTYNNRNLTTNITTGATLDIGYGYDSRGNMTSLSDNLDGSKNQTFSYDELNRLQTFNAAGLWGTGSFTYYSSGNRKTKTVAGVTTNYNYSNNRLTSTTGGEPSSFGYNNDGDVTSLNGYSLTYDKLHNLTAYDGVSFSYDGDGMRLTKTSNGNTTVYHYDQHGMVISENDTNVVLIADYIYLHAKLAAKIVATPIISVTPTSYNFGNINTGSSSPTDFTVKNIGTSYLTISTVSITGENASEFSKTSDTCSGQTLYPNASCTIQVTFSPTTMGEKSANLTITSNDPDMPTSNISLSGTGIVTLNITKSGTGTGTVTSSPSGIDCGADCTETYSQSITVTLTAAPDTCSDFAGWSGACTGTGACILTMDSHKNITATFNQKPLTSAFDATPTTGTAPLFVTVVDQSTYCPTTWLWDFGDGTTRTMQNPFYHNYKNTGTYTVFLTVTNRIGDSSTTSKTITVQTCPNKIVSVGSTYYDKLYDAYNAAGNGDIIKSQAVDFEELLDISQNKSVTLEGGYDCEYSSIPGNSTLNGSLTVNNGTIIADNFMVGSVVDFTGTPLVGKVPIPLLVNFQAFSTDVRTSWLWNFGDGTTSSQQNPSNTYTNVGIYTVSLTASNADGSDTKTKINYITVESCPNFPVRIVRGGTVFDYSTLNDAYINAANSGDIIKSHAIEFTETLNLNQNKSVTFDGGYDCDYTISPAKTTLNGTMTVNDGTISIDNFIIGK